MYDITILPLSLNAGREHSELPGLYVVNAPRKAARLRAQDQLMLFLSLTNSASSNKEPADKEPVYSPAQQQEMLTRLADTFYTTSGSVTAGMRAVVTRLNDFLLNRNLRSPSEGQVTGALNLAVLHGSTLLMAHAGATQTLLLGKAQSQQFDDRQGGRGLGLSKQLVPRFYQAALEPGDVLLVCAAPPDSWSLKSLSGSTQLGLEHLRRRLLGQAGVEMNAAALKFQAGKGQIIRYRVSAERAAAAETTGKQTVKPAAPRPADQAALAEKPALHEPAPAAFNPQIDPLPQPAETQVPEETFTPFEDSTEQPAVFDTPAWAENFAVEDEQAEPAPREPVVDEPVVEDISLAIDLPADNADDIPPAAQVVDPGPVPAAQPVTPTGGVYLGGAREAQPERPQAPRSDPQASRGGPLASRGDPLPNRPAPVKPAARPKPQVTPRTRRAAGAGFTQQLGLALKSVFQSGAAARSKVANVVGPVTSRMLPQRSEPFINLSPASMLFIAICIPLVVVAIATTVYFNAGRVGQFETYLSNARLHAERASQQTDPALQRESWTQALLWLEQAEQYDQNEISISLRMDAQNGLDGMDGIVRLPYQQAVTEGFATGVNITRMAATLNDVYMLDSSQGRVLRLYRVGTGYMVDSTFVCGPGQAGGQIIGPLIDLAVLPPNNSYRATILATDISGNLVYCAPNQTGFDSLLLPAPDTNWGNIKAITIADGFIYVLDPLVNAVWYIFGNNGVFDQEPRLFFSNQVPQMNDVIDLSIDKGFLYLLHADGRMTTCEASGFELSPTRCDDPTPYGDARTDRESAPLNFPDARFTQMQTTQPPDPSLFALDEAHASIYHFSLRRLNLQRQYRAMYEPDFPLPDEPPTAFVITPNRRALLAFGNKVFYAPLP